MTKSHVASATIFTYIGCLPKNPVVHEIEPNEPYMPGTPSTLKQVGSEFEVSDFFVLNRKYIT